MSLSRPAIVVSILALIAAISGSAIADPDASTSAVSRKKVKKIARKQINKLAPGLSVAAADTVDGQHASDLQTLGRQAGSTGCNPSSGTFADCATASLTLPSTGRVLLVGDVNWFSNASPAAGECRLTADGAQIGATAFPGEQLDVTDGFHEMSQGLNAVTQPLGAGSHTFKLQCNQQQGDIQYGEAWLSAVRIGAG